MPGHRGFARAISGAHSPGAGAGAGAWQRGCAGGERPPDCHSRLRPSRWHLGRGRPVGRQGPPQPCQCHAGHGFPGILLAPRVPFPWHRSAPRAAAIFLVPGGAAGAHLTWHRWHTRASSGGVPAARPSVPSPWRVAAPQVPGQRRRRCPDIRITARGGPAGPWLCVGPRGWHSASGRAGPCGDKDGDRAEPQAPGPGCPLQPN